MVGSKVSGGSGYSDERGLSWDARLVAADILMKQTRRVLASKLCGGGGYSDETYMSWHPSLVGAVDSLMKQSFCSVFQG